MKIFKINDCDWYMANSLEEAVKLAMADTGLPEDEATDNPYELSEEQLDKLIFVNDDGEKWSFREELKSKEGQPAGPFASTEY